MIELTLKLYLENKRLIRSSDEDMQIGVSNLINLKVSDVIIIALAKSLDSSDRFNFIRSFVNAENWNTEAEIMERTTDLKDRCKPWSDLFQFSALTKTKTKRTKRSRDSKNSNTL